MTGNPLTPSYDLYIRKNVDNFWTITDANNDYNYASNSNDHDSHGSYINWIDNDSIFFFLYLFALSRPSEVALGRDDWAFQEKSSFGPFSCSCF